MSVHIFMIITLFDWQPACIFVKILVYKPFYEVLLRLSHYNNFSTDVETRLLISSEGKGHYLQSISGKTGTVDAAYSILRSCYPRE